MRVRRLGIVGGCLSHQSGIPFSRLYHQVLSRKLRSPLALEHVARYRFAAPRIRGLTVLEAASRTGHGAVLLAKTATPVVGVDTSEAAVDFATRRRASDSVQFQHGDARSLAFPDSPFDAVVSFETIEHVDEPASMVAEAARVLRPSGKLVRSTPIREVYNRVEYAHDHGNDCHLSEMTLPDLLSPIADQFEIEAVHGQTLVLGYTADRPPVHGPAGPSLASARRSDPSRSVPHIHS